MKYHEIPLSVFGDFESTIKLAGIEYTDTELDWMWQNGIRYIVKGRYLYEIRWSFNYLPHYYVHKIFTFETPQVGRGRHWDLTAHEVNVSYRQFGVPELYEMEEQA